jgi:hypothetical protein
MSQETSASNLFTNKGKKWLPQEEADLLNQYDNSGMSILEIAKIHKRTVEGVIGKLKTAGLVAKYARSDDYLENVVGYSDYLEDQEYREAERVVRVKKEKPTPRLLAGSHTVAVIKHDNDLRIELDELKIEITLLKQQMLAMSMSLLKISQEK